MIWIDTRKIVLTVNIIYSQWSCETQKTKDVETKTFGDQKFGEVLRPRLFETKKFGGCRDRDWAKVVKTETFPRVSLITALTGVDISLGFVGIIPLFYTGYIPRYGCMTHRHTTQSRWITRRQSIQLTIETHDIST